MTQRDSSDRQDIPSVSPDGAKLTDDALRLAYTKQKAASEPPTEAQRREREVLVNLEIQQVFNKNTLSKTDEETLLTIEKALVSGDTLTFQSEMSKFGTNANPEHEQNVLTTLSSSLRRMGVPCEYFPARDHSADIVTSNGTFVARETGELRMATPDRTFWMTFDTKSGQGQTFASGRSDGTPDPTIGLLAIRRQMLEYKNLMPYTGPHEDHSGREDRIR